MSKRIPTTKAEAAEILLPWIERQLQRSNHCFLKKGFMHEEERTFEEQEFETIVLRFMDENEQHYFYVEFDLPYKVKFVSTSHIDYPILICNLTMQPLVRNYARFIWHKRKPQMEVSRKYFSGYKNLDADFQAAMQMGMKFLPLQDILTMNRMMFSVLSECMEGSME